MKHTAKRLLSLLLAVIMIVGILPVTALAAEPEYSMEEGKNTFSSTNQNAVLPAGDSIPAGTHWCSEPQSELVCTGKHMEHTDACYTKILICVHDLTHVRACYSDAVFCLLGGLCNKHRYHGPGWGANTLSCTHGSDHSDTCYKTVIDVTKCPTLGILHTHDAYQGCYEFTWTLEWNTYTVTFDACGGSVEPASVTVNHGEKITAPSVARGGHRFVGWRTESDDPYNFDTTVTDSFTLYAKWEEYADSNGNGVDDEEEVITVSVVGDGTAKLSGDGVAAVNADNKEFVFDSTDPGNIMITATPTNAEETKSYVIGATVDGSPVTNTWTYTNGIGTVGFTVAADAAEHAVVVTFGTASLAKNDTIGAVPFEGTKTASEQEDALEAKIVAAVVNLGASVPVLDADEAATMSVQFKSQKSGADDKWRDVGFVAPTGILNVLNPDYGYSEFPLEDGAEVEVQITWSGNDRCPSLSTTAKIVLEDGRLIPSVTTKQNPTYVYGGYDSEGNEIDIKDTLINDITVTDDQNQTSSIYDSVKDGVKVTVTEPWPLSLTPYEIGAVPAGNAKMTVSYNGNEEYRGFEVKDIGVTVTKQPATIDVSNVTKTYDGAPAELQVSATGDYDGQPVDTFKLVAGIDIDGGLYMSLLVPESISESEKQEVQAGYDVIIRIFELLPSKISMADVSKTISNIEGALERLGDLGIVNMDSSSMSILSTMLTQLANVLPEDATISFELGKTPVNAGAYIVAATNASPNYDAKLDVGYLVIKPAVEKAELSWTYVDSNGIITQEALRNIDLDAVSDPDTYTDEIVYLLAGANEAGEFVMKAMTEADLESYEAAMPCGAYAEAAVLFEVGNTVAYATPIARAFLIMPNTAELEFVGEQNGTVVETYDGAAQNVTVTVNGSTDYPGTLTVSYTGIDTAGNTYGPSAAAPTNAGTYTVVATYVYKDGKVTQQVAMETTLLIVDRAQITITVQDDTVTYDGQEHSLTHSANVKKSDDVLTTITVITDENGNVNILFPESWNVDASTLDIGSTVDSMKTALTAFIELNIPSSRVEDAQEQAQKILDVLNGITVRSISANGALPVNAGKYTFTVIGFHPNYKPAFGTGELTIKKAALTITAEDKAVVYGDAVPGLTVVYDGFITGEDASVLDVAPVLTTDYDQYDSVGTYAITFSNAAALVDNNYEILLVNGKLTVSAKALTVKADILDKVYDGTADAEVEVTITGIVNNDDVSIPASAVFPKADAGFYPDIEITYGDLAGEDAGNYFIETVNENDSATITPKTIAEVDFSVKEPQPLKKPQSTVSSGTGYSAAISWSPDHGRFAYLTVYTATVTLTPRWKPCVHKGY